MDRHIGRQIGESPPPIGSPDLLHDLDGDTLGCTSRLHRTYGPLVAFPKGPDLTVFTCGADAGYTVFSDPDTFHVFGHPGTKNTAQRRFGLGLFGINGAMQRQHRRLLMPAVRKEMVEASAEAMNQVIDEFLGEWRVGQRIDIYAAMKELSLRVACRLLFGLDDFTVARDVAVAFQDWLDNYITAVFALSLPVTMPAARYQQWLEAGNRMEVYLKQLIELRRTTLREGQHDLLAFLLHAQTAGQISEAEVIGEMQTLFNASYQTTASGLTWTLLLLAQHPKVLRRLNDDWHDSESPRSDLLERVIRESLRVLSPVVFVMRRSVRPSVVAGHPLPEGTVLFHNLYMTHHLPELFPRPERFDPDRWLRESTSPWAYAPFAAGPRMCLGAMFSLQLFQLAVPAILRRFRLALAAGTAVNRHSSLTLGVDRSLPVTLHAPDGRFTAVPLTGNIHEMVALPYAPAVGVAAAKAA
jgi:cytochrome P450